MDISINHTNELEAIIRIGLTPEDYSKRIEDVLKQYQKTAQVPGFRPGKVPTGVIRKMYGKSVLAEELNKLLSESLGKYIYDNKLPVLGTPLPHQSEKEQVLVEGNSFEFNYEVGLAPQFKVEIPSGKVPYYLVKIDAEMVENDLNDLRRRYGKFSNPEVSEESSVLYGEFNELDAENLIKEGGNKTTTTISIEMIRDVQQRTPFLGLKAKDTVDFNPLDVLKNETEVAAMLKLQKDSPALHSSYRFTVMTVNKIEKADMNQELYDKVYGEGVVTTEEEFRSKIREGIASYFERESDRKLKKDLRMTMVESMNIPLPDEFLKKMLKANNKNESADFEHEYFHLADDLRWDLIQSRIAEANEIAVSEEEIRELARQTIRQQFAQYGYFDLDESKEKDIVERYLREDDRAEKLERAIRDQKVFDYLKKEVKLDMTELPYQDFVQKLNEQTQHELEHHHH